MSYRRIAGISVFVCLAAIAQADTPATAPSDAAAQDVKALIKGLDAEDFAARQQATEKLVAMGKAIHPALNKALAEDEELSPEQKSRIRDILIDDGAIIRLEKTSKLEQDQIEILQEMRTTLVKREDSYKASNALKKNIKEEELSDEALALFVYSIVRQAPDEEKNQAIETTQEGEESQPRVVRLESFQNARGLDSSTVGEVLKTVLAKPQAGSETNGAFGYWVREYVIPRAFPKDPKQSPSALDSQSVEIIKKLLAQDRFDEVTFDQLISSMCCKASQPGQQSGGGNLSLSEQTILPICYSRHCRSEHVGHIVQGIITQACRPGGYNYGGGMNCIEMIIHSPKFNEGHARALLQWLLPSMDTMGGFRPEQLDGLADITGETFVKREDYEEYYSRPYLSKNGLQVTKRVGDRVRTWWKEYKDKPLLSERPAAEFRYIRAEIRVDDEDAKLKIVCDTRLQPGVGQLLRKAPPSAGCVYVCQRLRPSEMSHFTSPGEADIPNGVYLVENVGDNHGYFVGNAYVRAFAGKGAYVPGEAEFSGQSTDEALRQEASIEEGTDEDRAERKPKKKPARLYAATMILPIKDQSVTVEQLGSVDFWVERIVRASADRMVRAANITLKGTSMARYVGMDRVGPLELEQYRMPAVEAQVRKLMDHAEPTVVAAAALILSRWQLDFDVAKARSMLESKDPKVVEYAAEALAGVADPEGIRWLIGQMQDPMRATEAVALLVKASASPNLDKEAKKRWGAELIEKLLPAEDNALRSCVLEMVVVKAWTGEDYGYEPGANVAKNTAALKRYHEWAVAAKKGS